MSDPLFRDADEQERTFAPQQVPEARERARLEGDLDASEAGYQPPAAAPVINVGSSPSSLAAPPNIGHIDRGGAPGDPQTQADADPLGTDE
jgi:hypothetical protein